MSCAVLAMALANNMAQPRGIIHVVLLVIET